MPRDSAGRNGREPVFPNPDGVVSFLQGDLSGGNAVKANSANSQFQIYGGKDPRDLPAYTVVEVAHYLRLPKTTLRSWVRGQSYATQQGWSRFAPLIHPPDDGEDLLSFVNLTEAYVLSAIRRKHSVPLQEMCIALDYLERQFASAHPLAEIQFAINGVDLFVERLGQLINVSQRDGGCTDRVWPQCHFSARTAQGHRRHVVRGR